MTHTEPRGTIDASGAIVMTRFLSVVLDSLPQAAIQTFMVVGVGDAKPSPLFFGSVGGCVISIAYLVATTELDNDTSRHYRTNFPTVHGCKCGRRVRDATFRRAALGTTPDPSPSPTDIPENPLSQAFVVLGITLFISGYHDHHLLHHLQPLLWLTHTTAPVLQIPPRQDHGARCLCQCVNAGGDGLVHRGSGRAVRHEALC